MERDVLVERSDRKQRIQRLFGDGGKERKRDDNKALEALEHNMAVPVELSDMLS